jgi:GDPmannose 4,6-dehydratase
MRWYNSALEYSRNDINVQEIEMPTALITGITGQDGSYLAEFLLHKGYEVHGLIRVTSNFNTDRIDHIYQDPHNPDVRLFLHYGNLSNGEQLTNLIYNVRPEEIYHMGAQSHVKVSFDMPEYTGNVTGLGTTRILDSVRRSGIKTRYYQASSSEMFGNAPPPQNETTIFEPRSPYAIAKLYAYWMAINYREAYDMYAANGILFNHESPRRGPTFLSRKVTRAVASIKAGKQDKVYLGNLDSRRDYGYTPEYVEVMWKILQQDSPEDFVVGTGVAPTIREFVAEAFGYAGMDWQDFVEIDPRYFRPTEVDYLLADPAKAREKLDWEPKVTYKELARIMVDADMEEVGLQPIGEGLKILEERFDDWHRWDTGVTAVIKNAGKGVDMD